MPEPAEPPCTRKKGHRWVPAVTTSSRWCASCDTTLPLTGNGVKRAKRVRGLAERDGWSCRYCRIPLVPDSSPGLQVNAHGLHVSVATVDHVVPTCLGGTNDRGNLCLACSWCNGKKAENDWNWLRVQPGFMARRIEVYRAFGVASEGYVDELLDYVAAHELWFGPMAHVGPHGGTGVAKWHARLAAWKTAQKNLVTGG